MASAIFHRAGVAALICLALPWGAQADILWNNDIDPATLAEVISSTSVKVGNTGAGSVLVDGGDVLSTSSTTLGHTATGAGEVTVSGGGTQWINRSSFDVGYAGSGTLSILDGAQVQAKYGTRIGRNTASQGLVTISGANSALNLIGAATMQVGQSGTGELRISAGGALTNWDADLGSNEGSLGTATVEGANSTWTSTGNFTVGYRGQGSLTVSNGGRVVSEYTTLGNYSQGVGKATVSGPLAAWTTNETLYVGGSGSGTLTVASGAALKSRDAVIGNMSGSTGEATVDGPGSQWITDRNLTVGADGSGVLHIVNGGFVGVGGQLTIDADGGSDSAIYMGCGATLVLAGDGDETLASFLGRIVGPDAIRYWDDSLGDWADISTAAGQDYTLATLTQGDWAGHTALTVLVPEPTTLSLLALAALPLTRRRRA